MSHSPIRSIKVDFHDASGMTPKQEALPQQPPVNNGMSQAAPPVQTKLDPLSETLFQGWGHANGLDPSSHAQDSPDNHYDFRGMFKQMNGQIQPPGAISGASGLYNKLMASKPDYASMMAGGGQQTPSAPPQADPSMGAPADGADPLSSLRGLLGR